MHMKVHCGIHLSLARLFLESFAAKDEKEFVNLLRELSKGTCSQQSAQVMFIYNINYKIKNGFQGKVRSFWNGLPFVTTATDTIVVNQVT